MRVTALTPAVSAAPGDTVEARLRIHHDGPKPATYSVSILGLAESTAVAPPDASGSAGRPVGAVRPAPAAVVGPIAPGASAEVGVPLHVPAVTVSGDHAIALEVRSNQRGDVPVIVSMTLTVGTFEKVSVNVSPSTIAGRRHARFRVDVTNRRSNTVTVNLHGEGPDLRVQMRPPQVTLRPGQRVFVDGRVKGPSHVFGDKIQHLLTIVASGQGTPAYSSAAFQQRPTVPARIRTFTAILAVVSLWAGIAGGLAIWWTQNGRGSDSSSEQTTDGSLDPLDPDGTGGTGDGSGDDGSDGSGGGSGGGGGGGGAGEDGGEPSGPITTSVSGTVAAGDAGAAEGVSVRLTPLGPEPMTELPEPAPQALRGGPGRAVQVDPGDGGSAAAASGASTGSTAASDSDPTKFWSARYGFYEPAGLLNQVGTTTISDATTNVEGAFSFDGIRVGRAYELFFSKPGFDSRAYVVVPTADGGPIDVEVVLTPGVGEISGVVAGDNGPLGGVQIAITDGSLVFTTTSSTVGGSVGSWSFTGLSTPGTYTLTATTRGFGTQVLQIPLQAGERRSGVSIQMQRGVGSILGSVSGNVDNRVERLGGITITASNGDVTRTTTTVTEGDVGSFAFPNLPIPGDWTVTAEAPGFVSQTRLVPATGNVTGVDFNLTRTTATVTGRVISDREGPLASAAVVVSRDGLSFRANTFATGDVGGFNIPDLPPGDYRIAFSRFDHPEVSRQITVTAGQVLDLGNVFLQYAERAEFEATARIEVRIIDGLNLDLTGATIQLVEQRTGTEIRRITDTADQQASFTLENIPPGTYRLVATKSGYRTVDRRISVGTGLLTEQIQLLRLGQAAGQIVDRFADPTSDDRLLNDYSLRIFRVTGSFEDPVETITVPITQEPEFDATVQGNVLRWETEPQSLTSGLYRIEVIVPPAGYSIIPNQVIDDVNLLPTDPQALHFRIPDDNDEPIILDDIFAVQFPSVSGRLLAPELTGTSPNTVGLQPLPAANAEVTLTCGTGSAAVPVDADSRFTFGPAIISENELLGPCTISATADGYRVASADLTTPIEISAGATLTDRVIDLVMLSTNSEAFAGKVAWIDQRNGNEYSLATSFPVVEPPDVGGTTQTDVAIVSTTPAIVAFETGDGGPGGPGTVADDIEVDAGAISIQSQDGAWNLGGSDPRQVFGRTTYSFTPTATRPSAFGPNTPYVTGGSVDFEIDENGIAALGPPTTTVQSVREEVNGSFSVFLEPADGRIQTSFELVTSNSSPSLAGFQVTATAPDGTVTVYEPGDPEFVDFGGPGADITIDPAMAGTWTFAVTAPAGYTAVGSPSTDVFVDAGEDVRFGSIATFVADARLTVTVTDVDGDPIAVDTGTVDAGNQPIIQRPSVTLLASDGVTVVAGPITPSATGTVDFGPFTYPVTTPGVVPSVDYRVRVQMPGYDTGAATITINGLPAFITIAGIQFPLTNAAAIPVNLAAGDRDTVNVRLPEFGSLVGTAVGQVGTSATFNDLRIPDGLQVVVQRIDQTTGAATTAPDALVVAANADPPVPGRDPLRFRVSAPAGCYQLRLSFPGYTTATFSGVPSLGCPLGGYELVPAVSTPIPGNLVLAAVAGTIELQLFEKTGTSGDGGVVTYVDDVPIGELDGGGAAVPVDVTITIDRDRDGTAEVIPITVPASGLVEIDGMLPGNYELGITVQDTTVPATPIIRNYPLRAAISMPFGTTPNAGGELPVTAVLPRVGGSIDGTVRVVNSVDQRLPLPTGLTVTQSFTDVPSVTAGAGTVPNTATLAGVVANVVAATSTTACGPTPVTTTGCGTYSVAPVPAGINRLTFLSPVAGYTAPSPIDVPATGLTTVTAPQVTYRALDVTVTVTVRSGDASTGTLLEDATVTLVPTGASSPIYTATDSGSGLYTFDTQKVPPSTTTYDLRITAADHESQTITPITINVQPTGTQSLGTYAVTATTATINVNVDQQSGTNPAVDSENASVALFLLTAPDVYTQVGASKLTNASGLASFTVVTAGTYRVEVTKTGFATRELPVGTGEVLLGTTTNVPVLLPQLATYPITVSNVGSQPASSSLRGETIVPDDSITATRGTGGSARVLTFSGLDPDVGYQFRIFSTEAGWRDQLVPPTGTFDPIPGTNPGQTISFTQLASATVRVRTGTADTPGTPVEGATVTATNPSYPTRTGTTNDDGLVTFSGNNGLNLGEWTITALKNGVGIDVTDTPIVVTNTSPNPPQTELYLSPRSLDYTFTVTVTTPAGTPLNGASVTFGGTTKTTGEDPFLDGQAVFTVSETLASFDYSVTATGYITANGTAPLTGDDEVVPVVMYERPDLTGTLTVGTTLTSGLPVYLCAGTVTACDADNDLATVDTIAGGVFTFADVDKGTYTVGTSNTQGDTVAARTVSETGTVTGTGNLTLTLPTLDGTVTVGGAFTGGITVYLCDDNADPCTTAPVGDPPRPTDSSEATTGAFSFATLAPDTYSVGADGAQGNDTVAGIVVDLAGNISTNDVTIELTGPTLGGTVTVDGTATGSVSVYLCDDNAAACNDSNDDRSTSSAPTTGAYSFANLPPGTYSVGAVSGTDDVTVRNIVVGTTGTISSGSVPLAIVTT
jgi:hypothetical protein